MEKKLLVFDMDGTIADLYGQENWLEDICAKKTAPYSNAKPLFDMRTLVRMLNKIKDIVEIAVATWGPKEKDPAFLKEVRKAKKAWLDSYEFPYDRFHCTEYGYSKRYPVSPNKTRNAGIPQKQILFDDNPEIRQDWERWDYHKAIPQDEMIAYIEKLVREKEGYGNEMVFQPDLAADQEIFMVLDCETATLPFVNEWRLTPKQKQNIAIAKPLIYDIAWQMINKNGKVRGQHSFLIQETFFVPNVFNTAYYSWKRPLYIDRLKEGKIKTVLWDQAISTLIKDLNNCKYATAYNAMFDFKKAIPFTDSYMGKLYGNQYNEWEKKQKEKCVLILEGYKPCNPQFDGNNLELRGQQYPIADIWGLSCMYLLNTDEYKSLCLSEGMVSESGLYFKTSAETAFRYLAKDINFEEEHTALSDVMIESNILTKIMKKGPVERGIIYFPFKKLGETVSFLIKKAEDVTFKMFSNVVRNITTKLEEYENTNPFQQMLETELLRLGAAFPQYAGKVI